MKIIANGCFGGFSVSEKALLWFREKMGQEAVGVSDLSLSMAIEYSISRNHPLLVQCFEELGEEMNGRAAKLYMHEGPDEPYWIQEYDGSESVRTMSDSPWKDPAKIKGFDFE
jgi:hypothetical protein